MALPLPKQRAPFARPRLLLLYCRPSGGFAAHDALVAALGDELAADVDVETRSPSEAARRLRAWVSATQPTLFVLRDGAIVAVAVGPLSRFELERLVQHALL
jgi:hypothetical protein